MNTDLVTMALTVSGDGLEIPEEYQTASKIVIRTPSSTIDMSSGFSMFVENDKTKLINPDQFNAEEDLENPDLAPDKVTIKPYGENKKEYTVEIESSD